MWHPIHEGNRAIILYIYHDAKFEGPATKLVFLPLCKFSALRADVLVWSCSLRMRFGFQSRDEFPRGNDMMQTSEDQLRMTFFPRSLPVSHPFPLCGAFKPFALLRSLLNSCDGDYVMWTDASRHAIPTIHDKDVVRTAVNSLMSSYEIGFLSSLLVLRPQSANPSARNFWRGAAALE